MLILFSTIIFMEKHSFSTSDALSLNTETITTEFFHGLHRLTEEISLRVELDQGL